MPRGETLFNNIDLFNIYSRWRTIFPSAVYKKCEIYLSVKFNRWKPYENRIFKKKRL